jgi:Uri superfamily endonuclease
LNGIYALEIRLGQDTCVKVGALGEISFKKGCYVYVGSAQKNLEKRVQRHLRKEKKLFWHIDYLLDNKHGKITRVLFRQAAGKTEECAVAQELERLGAPVNGFGCSDCHCRSHLFWFPNSPVETPNSVFTKHETLILQNMDNTDCRHALSSCKNLVYAQIIQYSGYSVAP